MSYVTSEDIRSLRADLNSLRDDIGDRVRTAADKGWSGAMDSAQSIVDEIRAVTNKPVWVTEAGASSFGAEEVQEWGMRKTADLLLPVVDRV